MNSSNNIVSYYSIRELALRNGQDMDEIWIACDGKIYDISNSRFWRNGRHYIDHWAGQDLTEEIKLAPHSADVFRKFKIVGILKT